MKRKKKAPMLLIFAVTLAVGSLISIISGGGTRPLLMIARLVYFGLINTPGEDLAAIFLVVTVFSLGAIAAIAVLIPRIKLRDEKWTKIGVWAMQLAQILLVAPPIVAGAAVSVKLSVWFIIPVLILTLLSSLYLIGRVWLLNFKVRK